MRRCLNCMSEYPEQYEDRCPNCGYVHGVTQSGDVSLSPGSILQGRYIVGTVIRSRETDLFYNGWDALFDRRVRIQEYFPRYCATRSMKQELSIYEAKKELYEQGLNLFYEQNRQLIRLYREEDIITCYACFRENRTAYAVLEYRDFKTLEEWSTGRMVREREAMTFLHQAMECIDQCHQVGIYHGRPSLDNFWVAGNHKLILKDFEAWRYVSGKPGIVDYGKAGTGTDVYGLARMFCMLTGGKEAAGDDAKLFQNLARSRLHLRPYEAEALRKALEHDTPSLSEFREELEGEKAIPGARGHAKRTRRRDAEQTFTLPRWSLAAVVAAAVLILGVTVFSVRHIRLKSAEGTLEQQQVRVPNLVNKEADDAARLLKTAGLEMSKEMMEYSDEMEEGMIIYQTPKEGTTVQHGDTVSVSISKGKRRLELPAVNGMKQETAVETLKEAGFDNIKIEEREDAEKQSGTVLEVAVVSGQNKAPRKIISLIDQLLGEYQSKAEKPESDTELVVWDAEILLTICKNSETQPEHIEVTVPNLVGMQVSEAEDALKEMKVKELKLTAEEGYSDQPVGVIISQSPEAESVTTDSFITVTVSKGEAQVRMEDLKLMQQSEAESWLTDSGLSVGEITSQYSDDVAAEKIISQSIAKDTMVDKKTAVDLVVSKGKKPEETKAAVKETTKAATKAPAKETTKASTKAPVETTAAPTEAVTVLTTAAPTTAPLETTSSETTAKTPTAIEAEASKNAQNTAVGGPGSSETAATTASSEKVPESAATAPENAPVVSTEPPGQQEITILPKP